MSKENVARRYSAALYSLAQDQGRIQECVAQMDAFVDILHTDPVITEFFYSPVVERDVKQRVLGSALDGRLSELAVNFLSLLVRKRRENLVDLIARQLHELYDAHAGRQTADIDTAKPLSADELAMLSARLSRIYDRTLMPRAKVAPGLLGGLIIKVGDRYVDASVAGRLEEIRRHLLAGAQNWSVASRRPSPNGVPL